MNERYDAYMDGYQQGQREAREQCALEQRYLRAQLDNLVRMYAEYESRLLRPMVLQLPIKDQSAKGAS